MLLTVRRPFQHICLRHGAHTGCAKVEAPELGHIAEGEAEEKGFSADVATRQKKRFSNEDLQATFKRMRTDMGKDEASGLGLFKDVKGPGQDVDVGSAFDQAVRTPQRRHPTDRYSTAISVVPAELVGMLPAALRRAHCHLRCLSPTVRLRPSAAVRPPSVLHGPSCAVHSSSTARPSVRPPPLSSTVRPCVTRLFVAVGPVPRVSPRPWAEVPVAFNRLRVVRPDCVHRAS